ncbi:MAG: hypothetical protein IJV55_02820 [Paludibacteraceae bacterium]|nr:hypothetical protein [Paludibacteraceae bacterium]MBQ9705112.1 hypothetical protein [Paludibacteraceae bacterium]
MKTKSILSLLAAAVVAVLLAGCGAKRSQAYYDFKSKIIGTELDGSYTIRAWGRARNAADAAIQARKTAVYDVIFNGVESSVSSVQSLRPLLFEVNAKQKYEDYFNAFFADRGAYEQYCSQKETRLGSNRYARTDAQSVVEATVCVYRSELRKRLQADGIIQPDGQW